MQPPSTVVIGTVTYQVMILPSEKLWKDSGMNLLGHCRHPEAELRVLEGLSDDRTAQIVLHEAIHAIAEDAGIDLKEKEVRAVCNGIFNMLRNNPDFALYLLTAGK